MSRKYCSLMLICASAFTAICYLSTLAFAEEQTLYFEGRENFRLAPRSALVIGISQYQEPTFPKLQNPANDAQAIGSVLKDLGFELFDYDTSTPITRQRFKRIWYDYIRSVKKRGGVSLLYFAGHGLTYNGSVYLVPYDGMAFFSRDVREELIPFDLITDALNDTREIYNIVILDACRNMSLSQLRHFGKNSVETAGPISLKRIRASPSE